MGLGDIWSPTRYILAGISTCHGCLYQTGRRSVVNSPGTHGAQLESDVEKLECGPMSIVMAALPNIGGALCESSVIPFLVPCCKLWLMPVLQCRAVTLPM